MDRARDLGAVAYLVKPFDIDRLIHAVATAAGAAEPAPRPIERRDLGVDPA